MMKVNYAENISVQFTKTHIGHECEIGRLQLTDEEKQDIATKLASSIPIESILDEIRDNFSDKLGRLDLLTRRDVHNIKHQFNLPIEGINHVNDAESIKIWVNSLIDNENSPIIYYKIQGEIDNNFPCLESNDFMLVLMNDIQKDMMSMYGNDVITVDFTHGMNPYNFDLATILVIDHKREGFPAAFIFSNRQDSIALKVAFQNIKSNGTMNIKPKVFMSDDSESFYNAWCSVFPEAENRLLCTWHIYKAWRKNIEKMITNKDEQIIVYKTLRCLLSETDIDAFVLMHQNFLNYLQNNEPTKEFSKYFNSTYSKRCEMWAYCYRKWAGINTNMHIDRMHRSIKYIYLKGRKARRLDVSIHALMKFLRDKVATQLIALKRGKISSKLSNLRKRHSEALNLSKDNVIKEGEKWIVSSSANDELYAVSYNGPCSQSCSLKCSHCSYCIHNYHCTCIDNSIQWNMCKHIHLVCMLNKSVEDGKGLVIYEVYIEPLQNQEEKILEKLELKEKNNLEDVIDYKQNMSKLCEEMIESCSTIEECRELMKKFKNVQASFMGFKTISKKVPPSKRAFPATVSEPSNKKIKRQGFFSTKKKLQRSKKILSKPTRKNLGHFYCINF